MPRTRRRAVQTAEGRIVQQIDKWISTSTDIVIREAEDLEQVETALLEARFAGSPEDVAISYLYLIPPRSKDRDGKPLPKDKQRPGIVGPNADFVNQMVRMLNATQRTQMTIADEPPLFQDTVNAYGQPAIRCIVKAIDKTTGDVRWATKVEAKSTHAETIALVKAQKKALESLPSYDRRAVAQRIVKFIDEQTPALRAHGIEPTQLVVAGMGAVSQWSEVFAKARAAGVKPEQLRSGIRKETGKGLSEVESSAEVGRAMAAADKVIEQAPLFQDPPQRGRSSGTATMKRSPAGDPPKPAEPAPPAAELSPEDAAERDRLLNRILDGFAALGTNPRVIGTTLKQQFGKELVEELNLEEMRRLYQQVLRRLEAQRNPQGVRR